MVRKIIWTPEAEKTFDVVIKYLEENWSKNEARNFFKNVNKVVSQIKRYPNSFRSSGKSDIREALVSKHNILFYRVSNEKVFLLYFWDTRRNPIKKSN